MGAFGIAVLALALAGAAASWVVAAVHYARALAATEDSQRNRLRWLAVAAWPFAVRRLQGSASAHAAVVNKAIVAFFVCLMVAATTISLSTNLNRIAQ
jgi:hypothetical protein